MKRVARWGPPGWPWELELLSFVFVVTAIVVPYYLQLTAPPSSPSASILAQADQLRERAGGTWQDLEEFIWALAIVGFYLAHLVIASASLEYISTPATHLFSPLIFALVTYYRLYAVKSRAPSTTAIVVGTPLEAILWVVGVLAITLVVARIRMVRYMLNFRHVDWDFSTPSVWDKTYASLILYLRPLIYPPRMYRACPDGVLIEGWLYAMPIPFDTINSVDAVQGAGFLQSSYCLATSTRSLVRLQLADKPEPILISPKDRAEFIRYCQQRLLTTRRIRIQPEKPGTTART